MLFVSILNDGLFAIAFHKNVKQKREYIKKYKLNMSHQISVLSVCADITQETTKHFYNMKDN